MNPNRPALKQKAQCLRAAGASADRLKPVEKPVSGESVGPLQGAMISRRASAPGVPVTCITSGGRRRSNRQTIVI
jgi:hypothetical protein